MKSSRLWCFAWAWVVLGAVALEADETDRHPAIPQEASITHHSVEIAGEPVRYTATAGTIPLADKEGNPLAHVFFIAYTKDGVDDVSNRPLLFSFNGLQSGGTWCQPKAVSWLS